MSWRMIAIVLTLAVLAATAVATPALAAKKKHRKPAPRSLTTFDAADPSVVRVGAGILAVSTGDLTSRASSGNGRHFTADGSALLRRPKWSNDRVMWAADIATYGGQWLLFFAAPVKGLKTSSHCIGVATAPTPTSTFIPNDQRPLVCPPNKAIPAAEDQFIDPMSTQTPTATPTPSDTASPSASTSPSTSVSPSPTSSTTAPILPTLIGGSDSVLPSASDSASTSPSTSPSPTPRPDPNNAHGAIDPSFTIINGSPYLLYKTDGTPSSIRILPLTLDGLHAAGESRQILKVSGVEENPLLIRDGDFWFLFTSVGNYTTCDYSTAWRRSTNPLGSFQSMPRRDFLTHTNTRLCGPGGADAIMGRAGGLMYFHGWTCAGRNLPCKAPLYASRSFEAKRRPVRSLYGIKIEFTPSHRPVIKRWLKP